MSKIPLTIGYVAEKLKGIVSEDYKWPETPCDYQLEFILHPDGSIILDFLNLETGVFWSEVVDEEMQTPFIDDGTEITTSILNLFKIPYMR